MITPTSVLNPLITKCVDAYLENSIRNMKKFIFSIFIATIFSLIGINFAQAQIVDLTKCGIFNLYIANGDVSYFDIKPEGVSVGDRRVGRYGVIADNGKKIGTFVFTGTIMPPSDSGNFELHATAYYQLPNGSLTTAMVYRMVDASKTSDIPDRQFTYPVVGGTGTFVGARGILRSSKDSKGRRVHNFDITCLN
mgnify:CR=1 FL=1